MPLAFSLSSAKLSVKTNAEEIVCIGSVPTKHVVRVNFRRQGLASGGAKGQKVMINEHQTGNTGPSAMDGGLLLQSMSAIGKSCNYALIKPRFQPKTYFQCSSNEIKTIFFISRLQ